MPKWVIGKITNFLQLNQGFTVESTHHEKALVQDVMGFRYEIVVRNLGRTQLWASEKETNLTKEQLKQIREMA